MPAVSTIFNYPALPNSNVMDTILIILSIFALVLLRSKFIKTMRRNRRLEILSKRRAWLQGRGRIPYIRNGKRHRVQARLIGPFGRAGLGGLVAKKRRCGR